MAFVGSTSFKVAALLLLSLGTILFFNTYDRYVAIGPELLTNTHFHGNLIEWDFPRQDTSVQIPDEDIVRLHSDNPANMINFSQDIPIVKQYPLLLLSCDIKIRDVPRHKGGRNAARVILVSHDEKGVPMYHLPHAAAILSGTHDWEHHERVFAVHGDSPRVRMSVQLDHTSGTMWVKNLSLRPLAESASFHRFRNTAILLWTFAALWVAIPLARSSLTNTHRSTIIALALAIMFGVLMPESLKERIGSTLIPDMATLSAKSPDSATFRFTPLLLAPDIYKAGHFLMFAMLAITAFYRKPYPFSRVQMLGYLLLFAFVTEVLQLLVAGRSAQFGDVLIDSAGIVTGWMLLRLAQIIYPPHS